MAFRRVLVACLAALVLLSGSVAAEVYLSPKGRFALTYADNWYQVDYNTVDYYLAVSRADSSSFDYDAVLGVDGFLPFHNGPYVVISVDTNATSTPEGIDSIVSDFATMYKAAASQQPTAAFIESAQVDRPNYDPETGLLSVVTNTGSLDGDTVTTLWALKFYDRGEVDFFCYAPDSLYEAYRDQFRDILLSFTTENLGALSGAKSLKLAEIDTTIHGPGSGTTSFLPWIILVVVLVVIVIVISRRRKRE
jgi:hypothetical protein